MFRAPSQFLSHPFTSSCNNASTCYYYYYSSQTGIIESGGNQHDTNKHKMDLMNRVKSSPASIFFFFTITQVKSIKCPIFFEYSKPKLI